MNALPALIFSLGVVGLLVATMPVYALRGPRVDADQKGKGGQLFGGAGDFLVHWFMWLLQPIADFSIRRGLTPDFYNWIGLALGIGSGVFIAFGSLELGGWMLALCGVADIMDGRIARATGVASELGDFIDSTFDRFVEAATFLGFAYYLRDVRFGPLLAAGALAGSLLVSYARARGEVLGVLCTGGLMQRGERLLIVCLVCLGDPAITAALHWPRGTIALWTLGVIFATTMFTAVHRTIWIANRLKG